MRNGLRDVTGLVKATTGAACAHLLPWNLRAGRKENVKMEEAPRLVAGGEVTRCPLRGPIKSPSPKPEKIQLVSP